MAMLAAACGPVEVASAPELISPHDGAGNPTGPANETAVTFVPTSPAGGAAIVVPYNDNTMGIAFGISRATAAAPTTWSTCDAPTCGPSGGAVPRAIGTHTQQACQSQVNCAAGQICFDNRCTIAQRLACVPAPVGDVCVNTPAFAGDPAVAAAVSLTPGASASGVVVAANLAYATPFPRAFDAVVALASLDGGATWTQSVMVTPNGTTPCDSGTVDQPSIAYDSGATATGDNFWIAWRHGYSICVRHLTVNGGVLAVAAPSVAVPVPFPVSAVGGQTIRARNGRVSIVYNNNDPSVAAGSSWYAASSPDGVDWSSGSHRIVISPTYNGAFAGTPPQLSSVPARDFGFDIDPGGTFWAAIHTAPGTINVYRSSTFGAGWILDVSFNPRLGPLFQAGDAGQPTLASDYAGNIGVTWYQLVPSTTPTRNVQRVFAYRDAALGWSRSGHIVISGASQPIADTRGQGWGDYQSIVAVDPTSPWFNNRAGAFYTAWTDTQVGMRVVHGARVGVSP